MPKTQECGLWNPPVLLNSQEPYVATRNLAAAYPRKTGNTHNQKKET